MSTTTQAIHNFSAGPCILPASVLSQASQAVHDLDGMGLSLIEISHRSKAFVDIMEEARSLVRSELSLPDRYEVLFLQGGASLGFLTAAMNFIPEGGSMDYAVTGTRAKKALKEAKRTGGAQALTSSEETGFDRIPVLPTTSAADFVHITTNNTIYGTQYGTDPVIDTPMVADMSSDIFSRPVDIDKYACIYAGAQKNMGPSGVTVVVVSDRFLARCEEGMPALLHYPTQVKKDSMLNTPNTFGVFAIGLVLEWVESLGLDALAERNAHQATRTARGSPSADRNVTT